MTTQQIHVNQIHESPTNPRKKFGDIEELATSIRTLGVLQPILVRPNSDGFECVFGHRRLRAAREAGLAEIPAQVRQLTDSEVLEAQLIENMHREDIHPLEEGDAYRHCLDAGVMTLDDLAVKVGRTKAYVRTRVLFSEMTEDARAAFLAGDLSPSIALLLTRVHPDRQHGALEKLLEQKKRAERWGKFTAEDAANLLDSYTHRLRDAPFKPSDAELVPTAGPCTQCPKRSGQQRALFAEAVLEDEDTCGDPKCWELKVLANWEIVKEKAQRRGLEVLESDVVFKGGSKVKGAYIDVSATAPGQEGVFFQKRKTYKQALGRGVKPAVALNPITGAVVEVLKRKEAKEALPAEFTTTKPPKAGGQKSKKEVLRPSWDDVDDWRTAAFFSRARIALADYTLEQFVQHLVVASMATSDGFFEDVAVALGWVLKPEFKPNPKNPWAMRPRVPKKDLQAARERLNSASVAELAAILLWELDREMQSTEAEPFKSMGLSTRQLELEAEKVLTAKLKEEEKAKAAEAKAATKEKAAAPAKSSKAPGQKKKTSKKTTKARRSK